MQETWVRFLSREDSPGEGNGNPFQYSCMENSMGRKAWCVTVHGVLRNLCATSRHLKKTLSWPCYAHHTGREASRQMKPWAQLTRRTGSSCTSCPQGCGGWWLPLVGTTPSTLLSLLRSQSPLPLCRHSLFGPIKGDGRGALQTPANMEFLLPLFLTCLSKTPVRKGGQCKNWKQKRVMVPRVRRREDLGFFSNYLK